MAGQLAQLAQLERIRQGAGESVFSFQIRIKTAANSIGLMKFGKCSKKTHSDLTLEECKRDPNDEPATELSWPCSKGAGWDTLTNQSTFGAEGILTDQHKACPPCCKKEHDSERVEWLIKKQFLTKMHNKEFQMKLHDELAYQWKREGIRAEFNVLDINMEDIISLAKDIEPCMKPY